MTLALVVALLLADNFESPERPVAVPRRRAVGVLASPRSTWEQRAGALDALQKKTFTDGERDTLLAALPALSRRPAGPCDDTRTPSCDASYGPCLSPAGFALAAVLGSNVNDAFVDPALALSVPGVDPSAAPFARRVLAKAKHAALEEVALPLLEGSYSCVDEGAYLLFQAPALGETTRRQLERLVRRGGDNQRALASLIAGRPEPWASALKLETLASADTGLRLGAVRLAWLQGADPGLLQAMAQVAHCDPSFRLQQEMRARFALSKRALPDAGCPLPPEPLRVEGRTVRGRDGGVVLELGSGTMLAPPGEACVAWAKAEEMTAPLGMLGARCVLALNLGEWGGGLFDFPSADGGAELFARNSFLHPRTVLRRGTEWLVLSASNRYGFGSGGVGRLASVDGGLRYEHLLSWNGTPVAWATTADTLFVTFAPSDFMSPCLANDVPEVTYRYANDGGWSLVRGDATTCLWPD